MIDIGSEISQLDNNSTCVSCFGGNLCSLLILNYQLIDGIFDRIIMCIACLVCVACIA